MRKFERISEAEFEKVLKDKCDYEDIKLPERSTKHSAGYDFISPFDFEWLRAGSVRMPSPCLTRRVAPVKAAPFTVQV